MLCSCSDYFKKLGNGYTFVHEGYSEKYIFHEHPAKGGEVPPTVISYDYNKHFIIAKQKPSDYGEATYSGIEYVYPLGRDSVYYWLIVKQEKKVLGPLDYDSFLKLKKEYKVPDGLTLE